MIAPRKALILALLAMLTAPGLTPPAMANATPAPSTAPSPTTAPAPAPAPAPAAALADQTQAPVIAAEARHEPQRVVVRVSLSRQRMEVFHEGRKLFDWPVSTARKGKVTPTGTWNGAQWLSKNHRSSLYGGAPMPYSIFFNGNYAIHGTDQIRKLGSPASAGCIRLHPENARILFNMVRHEGKAKLRVEVVR